MNIAPFIFIGLFATFSLSWFGYVFKPQADLGKLEPFKDPITNQSYPLARSGQAQQGAEVYRAQNCAACHTQQVRSKNEGKDILRGWGTRRTVAADYMLEHPPLLGAIRLGPDLANMGLRKGTNDAAWHFQHLLAPATKVEKSKMPPYPYLFNKRKAENRGEFYTDPKQPGFEFVPTPEGRALVAYLISLKSMGTVFEAPMPAPAPATNAPAGGTNAPAGGTNAPAGGTNAPAATTNAPTK